MVNMEVKPVIRETLDYLNNNDYLINKEILENDDIVNQIETAYYLKLFPENENELNLDTIEIENRRYLGSKSKLIDFIGEIVDKYCGSYSSFFDLFGGTGVVSAKFNNSNTKIIINDLLKSNYMSYKTWFDDSKYDLQKIKKLLIKFNNIKPENENYASKHFGGNFFSYENAIKIGAIRERIEELYKTKHINEREKYILITSLIYALDKVANTCGHYDAYRKKLDTTKKLELCLPDINDQINKGNKIYNMDSNELVRFQSADIVYIDPPYNSRQYGDAYHLLENIVNWDKPEVTGVAKKMVDRKDIKSKYCTVSAPEAFEDLISNINAKYILVSYNNMGKKGAGRSQAKISDEELINILKQKGKVTIEEKDYRYFTTGKSKIKNHKERIFVCKVEQKKRVFIKTVKSNNNIKSPLNYTGGKYKLLPQLKEYFPPNIDNFYDVFTGGVNVGINALANKIKCIDKQEKIISLYNMFKHNALSAVEDKIDELIEKYKLSNTSKYGYEHYGTDSSTGVSKFNKENFLKLREDFNNYKGKDKLEYLSMFFTLIVHSFNNQIRFNNSGEYNIPVGKRDFNSSLRKRVRAYIKEIKNKNIQFIAQDFRDINIDEIKKNDFVYLDPPYYIGVASYNENGGWTEKDELDLLDFLNNLNNRNIRFALSNVLEHKNEEHTILKKWIKENNYCVNYLDFDYKNSNYQKKDRNTKTVEVLVTNY